MCRNEIIELYRHCKTAPFMVEDMYFIGTVADHGAVALEHAKVQEALKKYYETYKRETLEHHSHRD